MSNLPNRERIHLHAPAASVLLSLDITPPPSEGALEAAIMAAAVRLPSMNRRVARDADATVTECEGDYAVLVAELEDDDDWLDVALEQEREQLDVEMGEAARFIILESAVKTRLIIVLHRLAGDGDTLLWLAHSVLSALAEEDITPPQEPLPVAKAKLPLVTRSMINMMNSRWSQQSKSFGSGQYTAMFDAYWSRPSELYGGTPTFDLAERCAAEGVSVESAVLTALIHSEPDNGDMALCKRSADGNTMSIRISFAAGEGDFWAQARKLGNSIDGKLSDLGASAQAQLAIEAMQPSILDAVWYSVYASYGNLMAGQARDLLGLGSKKPLGIASLTASLRSKYGAFGVSSPWYVPSPIDGAERTVGLIIHDGVPHITMQTWSENEEKAEQNRLIFLDALQRLDECL